MHSIWITPRTKFQNTILIPNLNFSSKCLAVTDRMKQTEHPWVMLPQSAIPEYIYYKDLVDGIDTWSNYYYG